MEDIPEIDFNEHIHRFAIWTSSRAVQRGFKAKTKAIKVAIEKTELQSLINNKNGINDFDSFHKKTCNIIIKDLNTTYGRAAKIVAIYIKTTVVLRDNGTSPLANKAHPPIDKILLGNLKIKGSWTKLNEEEYFTIINNLRNEYPQYKDCFWKIEKYWILK